MNLAILASHNGSALDAIHAAIKSGELSLNLKLIISNNTNATVLQKAKLHKIEHSLINTKNSQDPNKTLFELLQKQKIDFIFLAGYMKKLSPQITQNFKVINSHPALLPKFGGSGMYGRNVHDAVIANNESHSGVTIHEVNENYDEGRVILQKSLQINANETPETLEQRIKELEKQTIIQGLQRCLK